MKDYRNNLIKRITDLPASVCPDVFIDFTIRGEGITKIEWNIDMLLDEGVPVERLRDLCTLTERKAELIRLIP